MFSKAQEPRAQRLYRQLQKVELMVQDILEGSEPQPQARSTSEPAFQEVALLSSPPNIPSDWPTSREERVQLTFATLSYFYRAGSLIERRGPKNLLLMNFSAGNVEFNKESDWLSQQFPKAPAGEILRLKPSPQKRVSVDPALPIDPRWATFLFFSGDRYLYLLSSGLAEPWLPDHVEITRKLIQLWTRPSLDV